MLAHTAIMVTYEGQVTLIGYMQHSILPQEVHAGPCGPPGDRHWDLGTAAGGFCGCLQRTQAVQMRCDGCHSMTAEQQGAGRYHGGLLAGRPWR